MAGGFIFFVSVLGLELEGTGIVINGGRVTNIYYLIAVYKVTYLCWLSPLLSESMA